MKIRLILLMIFLLIIGFLAGYFVFHSTPNNNNVTANCQNNFTFINNGLVCNPTPVLKKQEYTVLADQLTQYIDSEVQKKDIGEAAVYFRDLNAGPTFGINANTTFVPASLLKLPLLITYLNLEDQNQSLSTKTISYNNSGSNAVPIPQQSENASIPPLEQNKPYTIDDLLSRMIIYSDNVSYYVLVDYLEQINPQKNPLIQTMTDLGLVNPNNPNESTMTVKAYASIFRQLYNGSYLSSQMSEKALSLMSRSTYAKGLVAGVPKGIQVSHKYGERSDLSSDEKQLHDCGIIYYPHNPYLLCVMTRGKDFISLHNLIATISKKVYQEVDARKY